MGYLIRRPKKEGKIAGMIIFHRPSDEILILKKFNGKWDLPKGHLDPGEMLYQAAVRETWEETGLRPKDLEIHPFTYVTLPSKKLLRFYLAFTNKRKITLSEHEKGYWFSVKKAINIFDNNPEFQKVIKTMYILSRA